jgi:hypothetical protein
VQMTATMRYAAFRTCKSRKPQSNRAKHKATIF